MSEDRLEEFMELSEELKNMEKRMKEAEEMLKGVKEKEEEIRRILRKEGLRAEIYKNMKLPELRDYQREAVEIMEKKKKGTIVAPTGSGKTVMALEFIKRIESKRGKRVAVLVPTEELLRQWKRFIDSTGLGVGEFYGRAKDFTKKYVTVVVDNRLVRINKDFENPEVVVGIYNSWVRYLDELRNYDLIVVDEVHHLGAEVFSKIIAVIKEKEYALGITSFPYRVDYMHKIFLQELPIVYEMKISRAIEQGWIVPLEVIEVRVPLYPVEFLQYEQFTDVIREAIRKYGSVAEMARYAFEPLAKAAFAAISKRKVLLSKIHLKKKYVENIVKGLKGEKVIVFSESIEAIEGIKEYFDEVGIKSTLYHSKMKRDERRKALDDWKEGKYQVLFSVRALEEGIDVPEVGVGIIIASGRTRRQFIQRIGRLVRPKPGKEKAKVYVVYAEGTIESVYGKEIVRILRGV